ncbi:MAG: cyclic nucleotide-binding domain-containing protein [Bdellovibrionaceae bacterium]|nr:cyclic nucleotide-binding domain-containing protein [Pseudobdellovibrionaceae bacterium]
MSLSLFWDNIFKKDRRVWTIQEALKKNIVFKDLAPREINQIQVITHVRSYSPGEPIFKQGEVGVGMYIISKGSVEIIYDENRITTLKEDDFFGELALVEERGIRTATAIAKDDTQLIGFFKPDLIQIMNQTPEIGVKILFRVAQVIGTRLHETTALVKTQQRN